MRSARAWIAGGLFLGLGGCGDNQSVLNPKGPDALELAHLSWLLFIGGTAILLLVVVIVALAMFGSPRVRAAGRRKSQESGFLRGWRSHPPAP